MHGHTSGPVAFGATATSASALATTSSTEERVLRQRACALGRQPATGTVPWPTVPARKPRPAAIARETSEACPVVSSKAATAVTTIQRSVRRLAGRRCPDTAISSAALVTDGVHGW